MASSPAPKVVCSEIRNYRRFSCDDNKKCDNRHVPSPKKPYAAPELRKYSSPLELPDSFLHAIDDLVSTVLLSVADEDRVYQAVSPGLAKLLGYSPEELKGKRVDDITRKDSVDIELVFGALKKIGELDGLWLFEDRRGKSVLLHFHARKRNHLLYAEFEPLPLAG